MTDFDFKAASESMMDFIKKVETEVGPRLPGSEEERRGAALIKEEYEKNMNLSQLRTQTVLKYAIEMPSLQKDLEWMIAHITANGLSASHPIISSGVVDNERSRRVEFRVRTNADEKLNNLQEGLK